MKEKNSFHFSARIDKLFFWYAFFMAFPSIVIFQNISVFLFLLLLLYLTKYGYRNFGYSKNIQIFAIFFAVGAIVSTFGGFFIKGNEYLFRSLKVLPNYIYWSVLIIFLVQHRNRLNFLLIFKGITFGLILSIPYFFFFQNTPLLNILLIFNKFTQNNYAFLLICFSPIAVYYIKSKYSKIPTVIIIVVLSLAGLLSGSRSGSVLVFVGAFLAYFTSASINWSRVIISVVAATSVFALLSTDFGEDLIADLNPRTHDLIYNTRSTFETDRSYLVRRALVDKGLGLFYKYPISGIGLNNFGATLGETEGNFEGSKFVIKKDIFLGKSAHNSYISILSEGGILMSIPFALILSTLIVFFLRRVNSVPDYYRPVFIAVLMMAVHLYFISAILNVFGWFLLGLASALVYREKERIGQQANLRHRSSVVNTSKTTI